MQTLSLPQRVGRAILADVGRYGQSMPLSCLAAILASFVLIVLVSCAALSPESARAATWPVGSPRLSVELGFKETYTAGVSKSSYVHSGLDATASAGSQIVCPIAATVSFTGSIPSGDSLLTGGGAGQTMSGVSLRLDDGRTLTLLPFAQVAVSRGDKVVEGQLLGTLAASGDRSSEKPHLHMGLKKGRAYYDPLVLFGAGAETSRVGGTQKAPSATGADGAAKGALEAAAAESAPSSQGSSEALRSSAKGALEDVLQSAGKLCGQGEPSASTLKAPGNEVPPVADTCEEFGHVSSGQAELASHVRKDGPLEALCAHVRGVVRAMRLQAGMLLDSLARGLAGMGLVAVAALACAIALPAVLSMVFKRELQSWRAEIQNPETSFLCARKRGDSIHKLFPAPGTPSFPGPLARRR